MLCVQSLRHSRSDNLSVDNGCYCDPLTYCNCKIGVISLMWKDPNTQKKVKKKIQTHTKRLKRTFIMTRTHTMQIFGEIPSVQPQSDT